MSSSDPQDDAALDRAHPAADADQNAGGNRSPSASDRMRDQLAPRQTGGGDDDDDDVEHKLWSGGYSGKAMFGAWMLLGLISVGLIALSIFVAAFTLLMALALVVVVWVIGAMVYAYRRLSVHYELTNQRFVHQNGLLSRRTDRIEVIDIDDVTCAQGPIERLFGIGTIVLTGSDRTHPTLSMIGIADVRDVASLIDDTRRKERRRRSLHIEAV